MVCLYSFPILPRAPFSLFSDADPRRTCGCHRLSFTVKRCTEPKSWNATRERSSLSVDKKNAAQALLPLHQNRAIIHRPTSPRPCNSAYPWCATRRRDHLFSFFSSNESLVGRNVLLPRIQSELRAHRDGVPAALRQGPDGTEAMPAR